MTKLKRSYSIEDRQEAYERYMNGESLIQIATAVDMPLDSLKTWTTKYKWQKQKLELQEQAQQNFIQRHRQMIMENRLEVTSRHLKLSKKTDDAIEKILLDDDGNVKVFTPEDILNLTRALKSSTDVSARAVGLSDKIDPLADGNGNIVLGGGGNIINIGMTPEVIKPAKEIEIVEEPAIPFD